VLVLRRRAGEAILVGEVEIEVLEISRSRVKLGVRAPGHVPVIRKETLAVSEENQRASSLIATRGREGLGEILQLLKQADLNGEQDTPPEATPQGGSNNADAGRYVTSERYSGYRNECENPHPA
jgi:carbon storage regulator